MLHYAKQLTSKGFVKSLHEFEEQTIAQARRDTKAQLEELRIKELMEEIDALPVVVQRFGNLFD